MRATVLTRFGGPEVLEPREVDTPARRADQMLVRVAACGVCGHDLLNRGARDVGPHEGRVGGHRRRTLGSSAA